MATDAGIVQERSISIGRVVSRGFSALGGNPATILGIAFVFGALPQTVIAYASQTLRLAETRPELVAAVAIVSGLLSFVLSMVVQGALIRTVVAAFDGAKASFADSLSAGVSVALPLIGLALLTGLGIALGFVLLVVPGVILALMWAVSTPALVVERIGVFQALGRSRELTSGARWKLFGMLLLLGVFYMLLLAVLGVVLGGTGALVAASTQGLSGTWLIFNVLLGTVVAAVWSAIQTSLYVELRDWKEGPTTDALADIFA